MPMLEYLWVKHKEYKMNMRKVKIVNNCFTNQIGELCSAVLFEITKEEFLNNK